jgi:glycerol-1-phosphate dehydrogenase [NAD(P)+]
MAAGRHDIFGRTFPCECGRTHTVRPDEVIYAPDALARLPEACARCAGGRRCAVLMDTRTRAAAGFDAARALARAGWDVHEVILEDPPAGGEPVCDDVTKLSLAGRLAHVNVVVPVGSGVLSDLGKWLAFEAGTELVVFATAASMNGYASANVAPTIDGVKTLIRARPPAAVLTAPAVLAAAPYELTAAGLGDALAKSVSSADWRLNHLLFGDYYCARSVALVADVEPMYLQRPEALKRRAQGALAALFDALLLTGVAMTLAETSAPASGGEHLIGHSLDMMSSLDGRAHDLHGRQVGVAAILTAELYRRVLAVESPELRDAPAAIDAAFWGRLAGVVAARYHEKADRLRAAKARLADGRTWDVLRAELSAMLRPPEQIRDCLAAAGAACRAEDIRCDRARLRRAFLHAHEIRPRFTVLDLAIVLGVMPAAAEEILAQWT